MVLINDNSVKLRIGDLMPHFALPATDGLVVDSSIIRDPVLVVVFTCNHCPYAKAVEGRLIELAKDLDQEGAQFVLINSNDVEAYPDDAPAIMKKVAEEQGYPFPYCFDETQEVAKAFGALCTPHCFVFDGDRKLRYKGRVDDNWQEPSLAKHHDLRDAIRTVLAGEEPAVTEANAIGCSIKWKP